MIDKIKKLLRLGSSANQHEAANALARAYELAQKHRIDLDSIDLNDESVDHIRVEHGARLAFDRERILQLISTYFRVEIILSGPEAVFIGRATDLMIAQYAYAFLLHQLRKDVQAYKQSKRKLSKHRRENFIMGWIYGVGSKLRETQQEMELADSRFALVTTEADPAVEAVKLTMFPSTAPRDSREPERKDHTAITTGYLSGKAVNVRQPLSGPTAPALTR